MSLLTHLNTFVDRCSKFDFPTNSSSEKRNVRQFLKRSIQTNNRNTDWFHPQFKPLKDEFQNLYSKYMNLVFPNVSDLSLLQRKQIIAFQILPYFQQAWNIIDRLPNFLRQDAEILFWHLFSFDSNRWFAFSLSHRSLYKSSQRTYDSALKNFALHFQTTPESFLDQCVAGNISPKLILEQLYKCIVFKRQSRSVLNSFLSALKHQLKKRNSSFLTSCPDFEWQLKAIYKLSSKKVDKHGIALSPVQIFRLLDYLLQLGTDQSVVLICQFMVCLFLAFRRTGLWDARWVHLVSKPGTFLLNERNTKTKTNIFPAYLPCSGGLFDFEFMLKILKSQAEEGAFVLCTPDRKDRFVSASWEKFVLRPINDALEVLGFNDIFEGKRFTAHSFRYTISAFLTDDLGLAPHLQAAVLKHVTVKPSSYSKVGQIYSFNTSEVRSFRKALEDWLVMNPSWATFWHRNLVTKAGYIQHQRGR